MPNLIYTVLPYAFSYKKKTTVTGSTHSFPTSHIDVGELRKYVGEGQ